MNQFYREKPFLISVLAPVLVVYGVIGIMSTFGKSDSATGLQNFLNHLTALDYGKDKRIMIFISFARTVGGLGLWQLKYWGAGIVAAISIYSLVLEFQKSAPNQFALALWGGLLGVVAFHYRDYD
jgi:uncharacterized membrane protein (DUF2068 family)